MGASFYSYNHLPLIDFMPYSLGSDISSKMEIPVGAPQDVYETRLLYKNINTGEVKEFTAGNYPWKDTLNWKWVNTKSVLVTKGYTPPIHDFAITNQQGNNITDSILSDHGYSFLLIAYNINKSDKAALKAAERFEEYCSATGKAKFYAVTASVKPDVDKIKTENNLSMDFNSGDETALKTIVRSNPGLILLKDGVVVGKWHYNDFGKISLKTGNFLAENISAMRNTGEWTLSLFILLSMGALLAIIFLKR